MAKPTQETQPVNIDSSEAVSAALRACGPIIARVIADYVLPEIIARIPELLAKLPKAQPGERLWRSAAEMGKDLGLSTCTMRRIGKEHPELVAKFGNSERFDALATLKKASEGRLTAAKAKKVNQSAEEAQAEKVLLRAIGGGRK